jgi:hypothetical protein
MCRTEELLSQLSEDERRSLAQIGKGTCGKRIPFTHAEKLIALGLTELCCGDPELTRHGRRALQLLGA